MAVVWTQLVKWFLEGGWKTCLKGLVILVVFCGGCVLGCNCASGAEPPTCPVNGNQCSCGCRSGQQCNCADPQAKAYFDLLGKLHVNEEFTVFVKMPVQSRYGLTVRWDRYPGVDVPCEIRGYIAKDGNPYESHRIYQQAPVVQNLPLVWSLAGCRSCR